MFVTMTLVSRWFGAVALTLALQVNMVGMSLAVSPTSLSPQSLANPPVQPVTSNLSPVKLSLEKHNILVLTPERLVTLLETDNLELAIAKMQIREARWTMVESASHFLPSLSFVGGLEKFTGSDVVIGAAPFKIDRVTLRQRAALGYDIQGLAPVFNLKARLAELRQSKQAYNQTQQTLLMKAFNAYHQWLRDKTAISLAEQAYDEAKQQRQLDEARYENGFGTQLAVAQSTVLEAERESDWLKAQNQEVIAQRQLAALLNLPLTIDLQPEDLELQAFQSLVYWEDLPPLDQVYTTAVANRPDLKALDEAIKAARAGLWESANGVMPRLNFNGYFGNVGPEMGQLNRSFSRGVQVSFDGLRYGGVAVLSEMAAQRQRVKQAMATQQEALNQIRANLTEAYHNLNFAQQAVDVARKRLDSAQRAYEIAKARQETGVGIQLEIMTAQTQQAEARQRFLDAVMALNNSQIRLMYETGQLTHERVLLALDNGDVLRPPVQQAMQPSNVNPSDEEAVSTLAAEVVIPASTMASVSIQTSEPPQSEAAALVIDALEVELERGHDTMPLMIESFSEPVIDPESAVPSSENLENEARAVVPAGTDPTWELDITPLPSR